MTNKKLVIIPTYNEIENIRNISLAVLGLSDGFDVLVVDDNSPDGTAAEVKRLMSSPEGADRMYILERSGKQGLGTAYIAGFRWALEKGYDYIIEMDADFSHNPQDLPRLYHKCATEGADVAVGSRYCSGVNVVNWPLGRVLISYGASMYVRTITGMRVKDPTAGFVCYKAEVLRTIDIDKIQFKGYAFQIEMKYTATLCGFSVQEVPIIFVNRVLGTSKMSTHIFGEALLGVLRLRLRSFFCKFPQKP